jgi:hypothetical protein
LVELSLEVCATSQYKSGNIDFIVRDKVLNSQFSDLSDVVVAFLITKAGETQRGLTTTTY